jgi:hypothetical protein
VLPQLVPLSSSSAALIVAFCDDLAFPPPPLFFLWCAAKAGMAVASTKAITASTKKIFLITSVPFFTFREALKVAYYASQSLFLLVPV